LWSGATPWLWTLAAVMWITGTALFAAGWALDARGWWEHRPFLTNIASTFTGAFFAIPVALLLIQNIARREARASALRLGKQTLIDLIMTSEAIVHEADRALKSFLRQSAAAIECRNNRRIRSTIVALLEELEESLLKDSTASRYSVEGSLARLTHCLSNFEHCRAQLMVTGLPPLGREKMTDLSKMIDAIEGEKGLFDDHIGGEVDRLLTQVRSMPRLIELPEGLLSRGVGVETFEEDMRRQQVLESEYLRSFEPVKERLAELRSEAQGFLAKANAIVRLLFDIEKEWNQIYYGG